VSVGVGDAVGVACRNCGKQLGLKNPFCVVALTGICDNGMPSTESTFPEQTYVEPGGNPATVASVPVAGSDPSWQLTTCFRMTTPLAVTVKKHGVPGPAWIAGDVPPQVPCGLMVTRSASTYFFSAVSEKAQAGPTIAGCAPAGRKVTLGTNVVPVGHVPFARVPTNPVTVRRKASGVPLANVKVASF
jgi:hypothetical protein